MTLAVPPPYFSCAPLPEVTAEDLLNAGTGAVAGVLMGDLLPVMAPGLGMVLVSNAEWERYRNAAHAATREVPRA
jgi:hypothetical protein